MCLIRYNVLSSLFGVILIVITEFPFLNTEVTLTPSTQNIAENTSLTLTCSYVGNLTVETYTMTTSSARTAVGSLLADCSVFAKQPDLALYSYTCPTNKQLLWTIRNVTRSYDGDSWRCLIGFTTTGSERAAYIISVQVPIQTVLMMYPTNNVVTVQKNIETVFICKTSGGKPAATVRWYKDNRTTTTNDDMEITAFATIAETTIDELIYVTSTLGYSPGKEDNGMKIYCTARNFANNLTSSRKPQLNVQYPPEIPTFKINGTIISAPIKLIEGKTTSIVCDSTGNPTPNIYSWSTDKQTIWAGKTLTIRNIRRRDDGQYTCLSQNTMIPSDGSPQTGTNSSTIQLNVLYPPKIYGLKEKTVVARSRLNMSCQYDNGNPEETTLKWTRGGDRREWNSQYLYIENITKQDDMTYTCSARNIMAPTGAQNVYGEDTGSFYLNVLYKASIVSIVVQGSVDVSSITVDEYDDVLFVCNIDSNPRSNIEIALQDKTRHRQNMTDTLRYTHKVVTCLESGIYTCTARNNYNIGNDAIAKMELYIKCSPRPLHLMKTNFTSVLYDKATLNFTALAYPEPEINGFVWHKQNSFTWIPLLSNADVVILSSGLHTRLTIKNVSRSDFGHYRVTVTNEIGKYEQYIFLTETGQQKIPSETILPSKKTLESIGLIISVTLGILFVTVTIYAISMTIYFKRKLILLDAQTSSQPSQRTYANLSFQTVNTDEDYSRPSTNETAAVTNDNEYSVQNYTDLHHLSNDNQRTYDVIQKT